jgi:hypothetical protein
VSWPELAAEHRALRINDEQWEQQSGGDSHEDLDVNKKCWDGGDRLSWCAAIPVS